MCGACVVFCEDIGWVVRAGESVDGILETRIGGVVRTRETRRRTNVRLKSV